MALARESIYTELFSRLAAIDGLKTSSRRFLDIDQVIAEDQPALFLVAGPEKAQHVYGEPPKWLLSPTVYLYARTDPEQDTAPSEVLNPLLTLIETALEWTGGDAGANAPYSPTTLGRLCNYCRIVSVDIGEGLKDSQGVAIVQLEILALGST